MITQKLINVSAYAAVGCAIEVHKHLGPGLLESVFHASLIDELDRQRIKSKSQIHLPVLYMGKDLGGQLKLGLLIENLIIVEIKKAVDLMKPLYSTQLLSYLRLADKPKGLLINFQSENIVNQLIPLVTESFSKLPKFYRLSVSKCS